MSDAGTRAFAERERRRTERDRDELRYAQQRLSLGATLRRELHHLADGAGELAANAASGGPLGERGAHRLKARREYAAHLYDTARRYDVVRSLRLAELEPSDLDALGLDASA